MDGWIGVCGVARPGVAVRACDVSFKLWLHLVASRRGIRPCSGCRSVLISRRLCCSGLVLL
jgi:hypothetical protein